jgi:hypothetical protein
MTARLSRGPSRDWLSCGHASDHRGRPNGSSGAAAVDAKQIDFAVRFHIAVVDASLRAALEGHDNQIFHEGLTLSVADLAAAIRNPGRGCGSARCLFCQAAWKARA